VWAGDNGKTSTANVVLCSSLETMLHFIKRQRIPAQRSPRPQISLVGYRQGCQAPRVQGAREDHGKKGKHATFTDAMAYCPISSKSETYLLISDFDSAVSLEMPL